MQIKDILNSIKSLWSKMKNKSAITVALSSTIEGFGLDNTDKTINLNTELFKKGTNLTLNNGQITIGSGINYISVSANLGCYLAQNGSGYIRIGICKNGERIKYVRRDATLSQRVDMNMSNLLIEVSEGDIITFVVESSANQSIAIEDDTTYMTVVEI